jgi:hypothetical protein
MDEAEDADEDVEAVEGECESEVFGEVFGEGGVADVADVDLSIVAVGDK